MLKFTVLKFKTTSLIKLYPIIGSALLLKCIVIPPSNNNISQTLPAWARVPVRAKTFTQGGIQAYLRCVGGSNYTCEYSDIRSAGVFLHLL